jgi:23S rRNA pseudouridine1911/1915/1917 synthase
MTTTHTITVDAACEGLRLDKFLAQQLPDISRARLQALIEAGAVLLAGKPPKSTHKTRPGETFILTIPETVALDLTPAPDIKLAVVYEDDDIIILNKPPGLTVHPAAGTHNDTLVHALIAHCGASLSGIGGVARPGIVHRIDKDTSGLLAVAKNDAAHQHLSAQLKDRSLKRTYLAFAWGALAPREGFIDAPIARNPRDRKQMAVVANGKHAITHYETLAAYHIPGNITPLASKVRCELETGRTHQIRVHLTHAKCPLMGDPVYGIATRQRLQRLKAAGYRLTEEAMKHFQAFHRQALHAAELMLIHPKTNEEMHFECPLPDDLQALENTLEALTIRG